jgi:glycosyltransferase involved in cell wall biosynthesis
MTETLISVIIPCYNQGEFLSETLESLITQTYINWECFIVNDGSKDNTEEVANLWVSKDERIHYIYKENGGPSTARNTGILLAKGEYILPLDADDTISPEYLAKAIQIFSDNPATELVYCKADFFGDKKEEWLLPEYSYKQLLIANMIFCSCIYRRSVAISVGLYDEEMREGIEDWEFHLRLLNENSIVMQIDEILFHYRIKEVSRQKSWEKNGANLQLFKSKLYQHHSSDLIKFHGDWFSLIYENRSLKEQLQFAKNFIPKRSLKNLLKFLMGRRINFH